MSMASKFIAIGPFNICGATLVFPITYIFNDIFTEVYGYQRSRRIIWMGLGAQAFSGFAYWILGLWPPAPFWHNQEAYMTILGTGPRVAAASLLAYVFGEFTNSIVISKLKFKQGGEGGNKARMEISSINYRGRSSRHIDFFPRRICRDHCLAGVKPNHDYRLLGQGSI